MEEFSQQAPIGLSRLRLWGIAENIFLIKVCIPNIGITRHNVIKYGVSIGLTENLKRSLGIDGGIGHRKEEAHQLNGWIEILAHVGDSLADLHDGIQLKVARRNHHNHFIGGGKGIERQPGERRGTINQDIRLLGFNGV